MVRVFVTLLVSCLLVNTGHARPVLDRSEQTKGFFPEKRDNPELRLTFTMPAEWLIDDGEKGKCAYVGSVRQRWWREQDGTEIIVEAGIFPSREQALQAAELRVKTLKQRRLLQEQALKGGQLPGQANGDRVWGLWDPPETGPSKGRGCHYSTISRYTAVVFVKKDVVVQVSAENRRKSVGLSDIEDLARKIAVKINRADPPALQSPSGDAKQTSLQADSGKK